MRAIEWRQRTLGFTGFRWGFYLHFRWKLNWLHIKAGTWGQDGIKVSTRHQLKHGRKPRYVRVQRVQVSIWTAKQGKQGRPIVFGLMLYGGRNRHGY